MMIILMDAFSTFVGITITVENCDLPLEVGVCLDCWNNNMALRCSDCDCWHNIDSFVLDTQNEFQEKNNFDKNKVDKTDFERYVCEFCFDENYVCCERCNQYYSDKECPFCDESDAQDDLEREIRSGWL